MNDNTPSTEERIISILERMQTHIAYLHDKVANLEGQIEALKDGSKTIAPPPFNPVPPLHIVE